MPFCHILILLYFDEYTQDNTKHISKNNYKWVERDKECCSNFYSKSITNNSTLENKVENKTLYSIKGFLRKRMKIIDGVT